MAMARKSMGDYMIEKGYASPQQVEEARKTQETTKGDLAKIMVDMGINRFLCLKESHDQYQPCCLVSFRRLR